MPLSQPAESNIETSTMAPPSLQSQDPIVKTWHHDCSNATGFEYAEIPTDPWWDFWWTYTNISLESDGQSFPMPSMTNTSPVRDYYGPIYVYTLPDVFPLSGLRNFSVHMELNNSDPAYVGVVRVGLFDASYAPVLMAKIHDRDYLDSEGLCYLDYYLRNRTIHTQALENEQADDYSLRYFLGRMEFVDATWSSFFDPSYGLIGSISPLESLPRVNITFTPLEEVETARDIRYLVLMFGGYYAWQYQPLPPFRVHDIFLEYEVGGDIDTAPPAISSPADIEYQIGQTGNTIQWSCSDDHPYRYWVLEYERWWDYPGVIEKMGLWNGSPYTISVDGLEVGNRTFLLILQDKAGFMVWDAVTVMVIEHPLMKAFNSFISFISANWLTILILSMVGVLCIIDVRDRREAARRRRDAWSRSLKKQTNNYRHPSDLSYE
jgi:hypothetical protein